MSDLVGTQIVGFLTHRLIQQTKPKKLLFTIKKLWLQYWSRSFMTQESCRHCRFQSYFLHIILISLFPDPLASFRLYSLWKIQLSFSPCHGACQFYIFEPRREKTCLRGFQPGPTQTILCSHKGFKKKRNCTVLVAKTKALISWSAPLFSHRQYSSFLMAWLISFVQRLRYFKVSSLIIEASTINDYEHLMVVNSYFFANKTSILTKIQHYLNQN